jgi:hypothetical protein
MSIDNDLAIEKRYRMVFRVGVVFVFSRYIMRGEAREVGHGCRERTGHASRVRRQEQHLRKLPPSIRDQKSFSFIPARQKLTQTSGTSSALRLFESEPA